MFFGVPVCACLHCAVNFFVDVRLRKKGMPTKVDVYTSDVPPETPAAPAEQAVSEVSEKK